MSQRIVVTLQLALQSKQSLRKNPLDFATLALRACRREAQAAETAARSHARRDRVLARRVDAHGAQQRRVEVRRVDRVRLVPAMARLDHGVEELLEGLVALLV